MQLFTRRLAVAVVALAITGCSGGSGTPVTPIPAPAAPAVANAGASTRATLGRGLGLDFGEQLARGLITRVCADPAPGEMRCHAFLRTDGTPNATPSGYGPQTLWSAYKFSPAVGAPGSGPTVAIVDAYNDPRASADLAVYRSQYGLGSCTTANGCLKVVGQSGTSSVPKNNASWSQEISLDLDMVSANCPNCKILLVEATSPSTANLATGVNTAARLGAIAISNSYGGGESSTDANYASAYNHPGIAITASSGDSGFGPQVPAAYGTVTAAGGTSLVSASNARGYSETVWSGAGAGCSAYEAKPSWQHDAQCAKRTIADVAYDADPNTGVSVYDSYAYNGSSGWLVFGGTSVAAPALAAIYADGGNTSGTPASRAYANTTSLFDVTSGSDGSCGGTYLCTGVPGYDGPTGNGTPNGLTAF